MEDERGILLCCAMLVEVLFEVVVKPRCTHCLVFAIWREAAGADMSDKVCERRRKTALVLGVVDCKASVYGIEVALALHRFVYCAISARNFRGSTGCSFRVMLLRFIFSFSVYFSPSCLKMPA